MFRVVRGYFAGERGKHAARLFVFEFLVVMAGVLAAQGLQSWVAARNDDQEGRALLAKAIALAGDVNRNANYWQKHGQCLRDHVNAVARSAVAGRTLTVRQIGRPGLPAVDPLAFSQDEWDKVAGVASDRQVMALKEVSGDADFIKRYMQDISDQWATLRLLDGGIGPTSPEDRARVRLATAIIDNRVRWLQFNVSQFVQLNKDSGWHVTRELPNSDRLVDGCGLLKDWR